MITFHRADRPRPRATTDDDAMPPPEHDRPGAHQDEQEPDQIT